MALTVVEKRIVESEVASNILFLIMGEDINYNLAIYRKLHELGIIAQDDEKKGGMVVIHYLNQFKKIKLVIPQKEPLLNKTLYSVNLNLFAHLFTTILNDDLKEGIEPINEEEMRQLLNIPFIRKCLFVSAGTVLNGNLNLKGFITNFADVMADIQIDDVRAIIRAELNEYLNQREALVINEYLDNPQKKIKDLAKLSIIQKYNNIIGVNEQILHFAERCKYYKDNKKLFTIKEVITAAIVGLIKRSS